MKIKTKIPTNITSNSKVKKTENKPISECVGFTEDYIKEFQSYCRNSVSSGISHLLNDRTQQLKNPEATARQVNSWDEYGLLDIGREGKEWRKYSIMDSVWLNIIYELRVLGIPIDIIRMVKQSLEQGGDLFDTPMPLLEFCIYKAFSHHFHIVLLVFSDGSAYPITYNQYFYNVYNQELKNHVLIDLTEMLKRNFESNKKTLINKIGGKELSDDEDKLLKFVTNGKYEKVSVTMKDIALEMIKGENRLVFKKTIYNVPKENDLKKVKVNKRDKKNVK